MVETIKISQKLARIGIAIPIFALIIIIWSYFILKAAKPKISDRTNSMASWHPVDAFCQAQVQSIDDSVATEDMTQSSEEALLDTPCPNPTKTRYKCNDLSHTDSNGGTQNLFVINHDDIPNHDSDGDGVPDSSYLACDSDQQYDEKASWCDDPNLSSNISTGNNQPIIFSRATEMCCKDHIYESNINYVGLFTYLLITLPLVYFLVEKIVVYFINHRDDVIIDGDEFQMLGEYVSKNGGKYIAIAFAAYFIILPFFRFLFVSYKCEDQHSQQGDNCGNPCSDSNDCASLHGNSECTMCTNNVCTSPIFDEGDTDAAGANISISVCGLSAFLSDLRDDEIDELYNEHLSGEDQGRDNKISALNTFLSGNLETHKNATSRFLKFMPRQEIVINDTSVPFRIRIPNPTEYTTYSVGDGAVESRVSTPTNITGYNYILNNYIQLEDYATENSDGNYITNLDYVDAPDLAGCVDSSLQDEITCNKNHYCKWVEESESCEANTCVDSDGATVPRFSLPEIYGLNSTQRIDDLPLHNKVIRGGLDMTSQNTSDNIYPCNDVVIQQLQKLAAKSSLSNTTNISSDMDDWIQNFELSRVECADKQGVCYMDDYICKTNKGVPIPLKYTNVPISQAYTIGEASDTGCQHAMYPCSPSNDTENAPCTALIQDTTTGYLLEKADGGTCQQVIWDSDGWKSPSSVTNPVESNIKNMCVPNTLDGEVGGEEYILGTPTIPDASAGTWVSTIGNPGVQVTSQCKAVKRYPSSSVVDDSSNNPYYRWSPKPAGDQLLCSDWPGECYNATKNDLATYTSDAENECCVNLNTPPGSQSLFVTGDDSDYTPNTISEIVPVEIS